jgi:hypothetical protein
MNTSNNYDVLVLFPMFLLLDHMLQKKHAEATIVEMDSQWVARFPDDTEFGGEGVSPVANSDKKEGNIADFVELFVTDSALAPVPAWQRKIVMQAALTMAMIARGAFPQLFEKSKGS